MGGWVGVGGEVGVGGWGGLCGGKRPADMSLLHTVLITQLVYISGGKSAEARNAITEGDRKREARLSCRLFLAPLALCENLAFACACLRAHMRVPVSGRQSDAPKHMCNLRFRW